MSVMIISDKDLDLVAQILGPKDTLRAHKCNVDSYNVRYRTESPYTWNVDRYSLRSLTKAQKIEAVETILLLASNVDELSVGRSILWAGLDKAVSMLRAS